MANLRQLLREYSELDSSEVEEFILQVEVEWSAVIAQKLPDDQAAEVMEKLLGIPDWTKTKP